MLGGTPIAPDPRIQNTARWAAGVGWRVTIVGWDRDASHPPFEHRSDYDIVRIPVEASFCAGMRNLLPLLLWQLRLLGWLWRRRSEYAAIKASDLDTVLPALLIAKLFHKRLLYDIHDFYADSRYVPAAIAPAVRRIERFAASRADVLILPDRSRLDQVRGCRIRRVEIVHNTPEPLPDRPAGLEYSRQPRFTLGYVGLLSKCRGLLALLEVMAHRPEWTLEIAGYATDHPLIERQLGELPNVIFRGKVSFEDAIGIYSRANVVLCTYDPAVPNHRYSSPNKLAEALMLGKPLIVAEGTNIDRVVNECQLGLVVPYGDVPALDRALAQIASWDEQAAGDFSRKARSLYAERYSWNAMRDRFVRLLADLA
jgi:glycosyltransferase involved in cell wall biosynthesis